MYYNRMSVRCRHSNYHVCILDRNVSVATAIRHMAEQLKNEARITLELRCSLAHLPNCFNLYNGCRMAFESLTATIHLPFKFNSGHYMYHQFSIKQFYLLPTQCIYVFCVDLRTNSDYFPIQH